MRIGVVGFGYWGPNIVRNLHALGHQVYVFDREPSRTASAVDRFPGVHGVSRLEHLLDDPRIVALAVVVPLPHHASLVLRALDANKHVFVEKPLCLTVAEARAIAARAGDRIVAVGHLTSYTPGVRTLTDHVHRGTIGRPIHLELVRTHFGPTYEGVDVLTEVAAHDVAIVLGIRPDPHARLLAWGRSRLGLGQPDAATLVLEWQDGCVARIEAGWASAHRARRLVVEGETGTLHLETIDGREHLRVIDQRLALEALRGSRSPTAASLVESRAIELSPAEPLRDELSAFVACITSGRRPEVGLPFATKVVSILESARTSMKGSAAEARVPV
jgi:predicted dehydrogenase